MNRYKMTDKELFQALIEADQRRADVSLPLKVRVSSFETYALFDRFGDTSSRY